MEDYAPWLAGREAYLKVVFGHTHEVVAHSVAAVVNSGTASLETCLIGTPQVVAYSGSAFNFNVAKQIIKVQYISLGNLILGKKAFKELMQYYFTPENLVQEVRRLVEDADYRAQMKSDYVCIRESLGGGGASRAVAKAMLADMRGI